MGLATAADVEAALRRDLTADEEEAVGLQIEEASDLVLGYLRCPPPDPLPEAVTRVVAAMVAAVIRRPSTQPENAEQLNAGSFAIRVSEGAASAGPWLTKAFKQRLTRYRCAAVSVPLIGEAYEATS